MQRFKCWYKILCNFLCAHMRLEILVLDQETCLGHFVLTNQFLLSLSYSFKMPLFIIYK